MVTYGCTDILGLQNLIIFQSSLKGSEEKKADINESPQIMSSSPPFILTFTSFGLCSTQIEGRKQSNRITLVNDQLDAQFFYFIIRLFQFSTCFEQRSARHQEVRLY